MQSAQPWCCPPGSVGIDTPLKSLGISYARLTRPPCTHKTRVPGVTGAGCHSAPPPRRSTAKDRQSELFKTTWLTGPYSSTLTFFTAAYSVVVSAAAFLAATFLPLDFLGAFFLLAGCSGFPFAALTAAQRFLDASAIAFLPAALIFRFGLARTVARFDDPDSPRIFAQRRCWASLILSRVSAEDFRRLGKVPSAVAAVFAGPGIRRLRSSAICWAIRVFCDS